MSDHSVDIEIFIDPGRQGAYFTVPFDMPHGVEQLLLRYAYDRHEERDSALANGQFTARREINVIDLGLIAPDGSQVGASGSDKLEIVVSETNATPGYRPRSLTPGTWSILVGAYHVAPEGVRVVYHLEFAHKRKKWLKGDLHAHTLASDGVLTAAELGWHALRHGLDFVALTDHNQMVSVDALPKVPDLTMIPGVEWTHYQGHANFLGIERPYEGSFATNTSQEALALFTSARERGALITINHPFEEGCGFGLEMNDLPYDCLEIWNGPMRESNLRAVGLWQTMLAAGKKVPACGGSDYHRDSPFQMLGGPTTCVYARSSSPADILSALREGRAYMVFAPNGPSLRFSSGDVMMGGSTAWSPGSQVHVAVGGLVAGDVVRMVTAGGAVPLAQAPEAGSFLCDADIEAPGFVRIEVLRAFLPGLPLLPALISNPIYFDA